MQICGAITGGENRGKEKARLRKGLNVVVATPGRLLDHLEKTTAFHTNELQWLILDEADRLLDLGFEQKIRKLNLPNIKSRAYVHIISWNHLLRLKTVKHCNHQLMNILDKS